MNQMNAAALLLPLLCACLPPGTLHAAPAVEMKLQWPAGKRLVRHVETKQEVKFTGDALPQTVTQESTQSREYHFTVLGPRDGGGHELELRLVGLNIASQSQGRSLTFDSRVEPKPTGDPTIHPHFRRVLATPIRCLTDAAGRLQQLSGYPEWIATVTTNAAPADSLALKNMFSEDSLKQLGATPAGLPAKPVKVGEHWTGERDLRLTPTLVLLTKLRYTFTGMASRSGRPCAVWEHTGTITSDAAPGTPRTLKLESGKVTGKTWFDPALGVVVDAESVQELTLLISSSTGTVTNQFRTRTSNRLVEVVDTAKP